MHIAQSLMWCITLQRSVYVQNVRMLKIGFLGVQSAQIGACGALAVSFSIVSTGIGLLHLLGARVSSTQ